MDRHMLEGLKCMKICRSAPLQASPTASQLSLETVASYTLELDVGDRRGFSSLTLREVPLFLLDAFNLLRQRGLDVEGLFRKEGNCSRIKNAWPIYFGSLAIPEDLTTHDICSMIKRFFRELKTPLFANVEGTILDIASTSDDDVARLEKILDTLRMLPPAHIGTIAFLMRQLKYFGENHEGHHMTVDNLARVFAPTLFRDEGPIANGKQKKKKGSQERLLSFMRSDNDVKTMIVKDLIVFAQRVGLPRDYYIASRRPSDVGRLSAEKNRHLRSCASGSSIRSSSAKPLSRSSLHQNMMGGASKKEKHGDYLCVGKNGEETKMRQGRRSSSTVRELLSSISNKVLRRGASPGRSLIRRASEDSGATTATDLNRADFYADLPTDLDKTPLAMSKSNSMCSIRDSGEEVPPPPPPVNVIFQAGDGEATEKEEQITAVVFGNEEIDETPKRSTSEGHLTVPEKDVDAEDSAPPTTVSQRRSRRESPRKHLTANSKVKPMESPLVNSSSWMPSPAFEPIDMATKRLGDISLKRKESGGEKRARDGKTVRRNSSKKKNAAAANAQNQSFADQATSFMEERLRAAGKPWERRRRHTTPVKMSSMLRRNQPNTIATGLKNPQTRVRDRRSTTLSFRTTKQESSEHTIEKKKRRSESVCGNSSGEGSIGSDGENDTTVLGANETTDPGAVLEMKGIEARQRRAKRQKRKQGGAGAKKGASESPFGTSLLDDVTNEIERLERERSGGVGDSAGSGVAAGGPRILTSTAAQQSQTLISNPTRRTTAGGVTQARPQDQTSADAAVTAVPAFAVPSLEAKPTSSRSVRGDSAQSSSCGMSSELIGAQPPSQTSGLISRPSAKRVTSFGQADRGRASRLESGVVVRRSPSARSARDSADHHARLVPSTSTPSRSTASPRARSPYFAKPTSVDACTSIHQKLSTMRVRHSRERMAKVTTTKTSTRTTTYDENEFAESEQWKREIITRKADSEEFSHPEVGARPSVAFLKNNNRGMVQQRVNQFAQLGDQAVAAPPASATSGRTSRTGGARIQPDISFLTSPAAFEFVKPTAPPVTHGLRPAEKRLTFSPPCKGNVANRAKKFEGSSSGCESTQSSPSQVSKHRSVSSMLSMPASSSCSSSPGQVSLNSSTSSGGGAAGHQTTPVRRTVSTNASSPPQLAHPTAASRS